MDQILRLLVIVKLVHKLLALLVIRLSAIPKLEISSRWPRHDGLSSLNLLEDVRHVEVYF